LSGLACDLLTFVESGLSVFGIRLRTARQRSGTGRAGDGASNGSWWSGCRSFVGLPLRAPNSRHVIWSMAVEHFRTEPNDQDPMVHLRD
jgi:hypothetical protein